MNKHHICKALTLVNLDKKLVFINTFRPSCETLLRLLKHKEKNLRKKAMVYFHEHYSQNIEEKNELNIWLSGSLGSYKLADIRTLLKVTDSKIVTRDSKNVNLVVIGDKTKLEELPENRTISSAIELEKMLKNLEKQSVDSKDSKQEDDEVIELLLSNDEQKIETVFQTLEKEGISLKVLPLMFALFKVHKEKHIRSQAKELILKETNSTAKKVMLFCEARNFINAKYTVGMEEMAKIGGFDIELFLYYLVLNQKHHLGKEYLASLNSKWTQKLIEEQELLNKKALTLYGQAGKKFVHAKKIESFNVHAVSSVLWEMNWLKSLEIIDLKEKIVLPKSSGFLRLESLTLETKELELLGSLELETLCIRKCKTLKIDSSFKLPKVQHIKLDSCAFDLEVFENFLKEEELSTLKKLEIFNFVSYKVPKGFEERLKSLLGDVEIISRLKA
jgi:hypothetical protein